MFKQVKNKNIEYYISDLFPSNVKHAFTTRKGGSAPEPLDAFSMGTAQYKEHLSYIQNNRMLICNELGINFENLSMTEQRHTDNIVLLESPDQRDQNNYLSVTDGVIINKKHIPAMLFFADCIPVMIYDTKKEVLAMVHAGWKGTAQHIAQKAAQRLISEFGCKPENMVAAIGAGIDFCCFEVSKDVAEALLESIPSEFVSDKVINNNKEKPFINLKEINAIQLRVLGIEKIDIMQNCTCCQPDIFFSHRMTGGETGRHSMVAQLV